MKPYKSWDKLPIYYKLVQDFSHQQYLGFGGVSLEPLKAEPSGGVLGVQTPILTMYLKLAQEQEPMRKNKPTAKKHVL